MIVDENLGQTPSEMFQAQQREMEQRQAERARDLQERLDKIPPAAFMVVPAAVTFMVDRKKHPILWTVFGVIPLASSGIRAISKGRLF